MNHAIKSTKAEAPTKEITAFSNSSGWMNTARLSGRLTKDDEQTTGLHVEDIKKLLAMLQKLVNSDNTVVVEHNLDVIKSADWIIDLGPAGGHIVAEGRPEQVAKVEGSHTGHFLAHTFTANSSGEAQ